MSEKQQEQTQGMVGVETARIEQVGIATRQRQHLAEVDLQEVLGH